MSERSFDELSNLTEVAGLCYSPIANDALRRATSQMLEEAETKLQKIPPNKSQTMITSHQLRMNNPHLHQLCRKKNKIQPQEVPINEKIGSERKTPEAGSSQGLFNLLQELCQYETPTDENTSDFKKASQFFVIVSQNPNLHVYGVTLVVYVLQGERSTKNPAKTLKLFVCERIQRTNFQLTSRTMYPRHLETSLKCIA